MIRTLVEVQGGRVSIRETGAETTVTVTVDGAPSEVGGLGSRLYTAKEVGDFQASEAELVAAPLRRQIEILEHDRVYWRDQYNGREKARAELEIKLAESRELVAFKDKIRADADRDNVNLRGKVRELAAKMGKVSSAVHGPEIAMALDKGEEWPGDHLTTLANAVLEVRRIIGPPEPSTSQA